MDLVSYEKDLYFSDHILQKLTLCSDEAAAAMGEWERFSFDERFSLEPIATVRNLSFVLKYLKDLNFIAYVCTF